ncbi:hypothetical protein L596_005426 [Steinernema carpocapsae]|uniref:Uncharacterized protein n=1 Tax=Steinernema carpocapsae TaxID=34508 RepID=A0A4U8UZ31_STECR|nr:hypothetical protein L596_005426 [Steinernema carpocapsae]
MGFDPSKATTSTEPCHKQKQHHKTDEEPSRTPEDDTCLFGESTDSRRTSSEKAESADKATLLTKNTLLISATLMLSVILLISVLPFRQFDASVESFVPQPHRTPSLPNNHERKSVYSGKLIHSGFPLWGAPAVAAGGGALQHRRQRARTISRSL